MMPLGKHLLPLVSLWFLFGTNPLLAHSAPTFPDVCLPPEAGKLLSQFLEKPQTEALVPNGWHLTDTEIRMWKINIAFDAMSVQASRPMPKIELELMPKSLHPGLPHGKWFCFRIQEAKQKGISEGKKADFLAFAKKVDETFTESPFTDCLPAHTSSGVTKHEIRFPRWLYLLLGACWILLIPVAVFTVLKAGQREQ